MGQYQWIPELLTLAGLIALLGFTPQSTNSKKAFASGSAYSLTATLAQILFGTAQPLITLDQPGRYLIFARCQLQFVGATFLASRTINLSLARMNNTPAQLTESAVNTITGITSVITSALGGDMCMFSIYDTANSDDQIGIMGNVSVVPTLGSMQVNGASIYAFRLQD